MINSFKTQLIFGVTFVLTFLLVIFVYITTKNHNDFLREEGLKQSINRTLTVGTTSKVWLMSNDYIGLEEVIRNFFVYDDMVFISIINLDAKVIAHSQKEMIGKYISDENRLAYIKDNLKLNNKFIQGEKILLNDGKYIDVINAIYNEKLVIGFIHIRTDQSMHLTSIEETIKYSVIFIFIAFIIAFIFAYITASGLILQLLNLTEIMKEVGLGNRDIKADEESVEEIASLAHEFNSMLSTINTTEHSNMHQAQIMKQVQDSIISTDIEGYITSWNLGSKKMLGYTEDEAIGKHMSFMHREEDIETNKAYAVELLQKDSMKVESYLVAKNKRDTDLNPIGMIGVSQDISERREAEEVLIEQKNILEYQVHHNSLTGLPNRLLFFDRLTQSIQRAHVQLESNFRGALKNEEFLVLL